MARTVLAARCHWIVILCVAVILSGLALQLVADAADGLLDLVMAGRGNGASSLAGSQAETCDWMAELARPPIVQF